MQATATVAGAWLLGGFGGEVLDEVRAANAEDRIMCAPRYQSLSTGYSMAVETFDAEGRPTPEDAARYLAEEARLLPEIDSRRSLAEFTRYQTVFEEALGDPSNARILALRDDGSVGAEIVVQRGGNSRQWLPVGDLVCDQATRAAGAKPLVDPSDNVRPQKCDIDIVNGYTVPGTYRCKDIG